MRPAMTSCGGTFLNDRVIIVTRRNSLISGAVPVVLAARRMDFTGSIRCF